MFVDFFVIKPLVDLKIVAHVNATQIDTLTEINIGTVIDVPTIPNSETDINISVPRQAFDNLVYFLLRLFTVFLSMSKYLCWFIIRLIRKLFMSNSGSKTLGYGNHEF